MSGQVFRWRRIAPSEWFGIDGGTAYSIIRSGDSLTVTTNGTQEGFAELFQLALDLDEMEREIVAQEPRLAPYIARFPGLRLMRPKCRVEAFFGFLCTPNNHLNRIIPMVWALGSFGTELLASFALNGPDVRAFPSVDQIAMIDESALRTRGFGYRAATIPAIARQVSELGAESWIEGLATLSYESKIEELLKLKGIGRKLADCIALFALHDTHAAPVDTHLWQAAVRVFFPEWEGTHLTDRKYQAIGTRFRELFGDRAGYAHQYLFYDNMTKRRNRSLT